MAITVTVPDNAGGSPSTPRFLHRFNVVLDNSYPTGGYLLGLQARIGAGKTIAKVDCIGITTSTGNSHTTHYHYNRLTDKLMSLTEALAETANATDLSTVTVEVTVESY